MTHISSLLFGSSVREGPGVRRSIAFTFDDGPSPGTLRILDILASFGIPATFFQCGMNVRRHPDIARRVAEAGHEIGNHTLSHPRLCPRVGWKLNLHSRSFVEREFSEAQHIIRDATGATPTLLRIPYGLPWFGLRGAQQKLGLISILWTVIGMDWARDPQEVSDIVMSGASPGGIACLHDGRDTRDNPDISSTVEAVKRLIPRLMDQGYRFETVSGIIDRHPRANEFQSSIYR